MTDEPKADIALERIAALDRIMQQHWAAHDHLHESDIRTHSREVEGNDLKFAKANEVREQIDRERATFATRDQVATLREEIRLDLRRQETEADRRVSALAANSATTAGEKAGRATLSVPLQALLFTVAGAALTYIVISLIASARTP